MRRAGCCAPGVSACAAPVRDCWANHAHRYRAACESLSVADFEYASAHEVEQKLWAAHLKVNAAFRQEHKLVGHLCQGGSRSTANAAQLKRSKDHVVELRKFQKNYLHFIKASQRFYRQYILNFDTQFDGIPELRKIAQKWKDDGRAVASRSKRTLTPYQPPRHPRASASRPSSTTKSSTPATRP
jgi:hypothetical protein